MLLTPRIKILITRLVSGIAALVLLAAAFGLTNNFAVIKLTVTVCFLFLAVLSWNQGYTVWVLSALIAGAIFNPFIPLQHIPRNIWTILDIVAVAGLLYFVFWTTNPYWKGTRFEHYVSTLFPEHRFVIQNRTRDISKFTGRRVESDTHPDFVFRSSATDKPFAIECKWRSRWAKGNGGEMGLWWDKRQWLRYAEYEKTSGIPVFVAFGIGGVPEKPKEVYILPLDRLRSTFLNQTLIISGVLPVDFVQKMSQ